jgi:hypothetical protein
MIKRISTMKLKPVLNKLCASLALGSAFIASLSPVLAQTIPYRVVPIPADSSSHGGVAVVGIKKEFTPPTNNNLGNRAVTFWARAARTTDYVVAKYCFLSYYNVGQNANSATASVRPIKTNSDGTYVWQFDLVTSGGTAAATCYFTSSNASTYDTTAFGNQTNSGGGSWPWYPRGDYPSGRGGYLYFQAYRDTFIVDPLSGDITNRSVGFTGSVATVCGLVGGGISQYSLPGYDGAYLFLDCPELAPPPPPDTCGGAC